MVSQASRLRELDFSVQPPHALQREIIRSFDLYETTYARFGRQAGKSSTRPYAIVRRIETSAGFTIGAYVGPSHADAIKAFEEDLTNFGRLGLVVDSGGDDQDRHIDYAAIVAMPPKGHPEACVCERCADVRDIRARLKGRVSEGCRVYYVAGGPIVHRGFQRHKLHWAIVDEMSFEAPELIEETLSPMFFTTNGHLLGVGTAIPEGPNFAGFDDAFQTGVKGSDTHDPTVNSITAKSESNPYSSKHRIAKEREALIRKGKRALAACLFDGESVTEMGAVFTNLDAVFCLDGREVEPDLWILRAPTEYESVVISIDFGRHDDSTVVHAFCRETMEQLGLLRIQNTEYLNQLPLIDRFVKRFPVRQIWSEGREEAAAELLRRQFGPATNLVKWTNGGTYDKSTCVARGMDLFERAAWKMMKIPWVRAEFTNFERSKTPSGGWKYGAPKHKHDDAVASALYATYGLPLLAVKEAAKPRSDAEFREITSSLFSTKSLFANTDDMPFVLRR